MPTLLIDNYDSYTYNLFHLVAQVRGEPPVVLTNDAPELATLDLSRFDAIVVSPGPGHPGVPRDMGRCLEVLERGGLPTLGVCLGHQAIGWLAGADVVRAPAPRHGHLERVAHVGRDLFDGIPQGFTAVRYHSLSVAAPLPEALEATAWAEDGVLMALRHTTRPWWGVQFHPESVATEHGARMVENFYKLAGLDRRPATIGGRSRPSAPAWSPAPRWSVRYRELPHAVDTERAFTTLASRSDHAFWLDSSMVDEGRSRFSFLGDASGPYGEVLTYRVGEGSVEVRSSTGESTREPGTIFDVLEDRLRGRRVDSIPELPFDLASGYVGYFGYELKADLGAASEHVAGTPDAVWIAATRLVAVDHQAGRTWAVALCGPGQDGPDPDPDGVADAERWLEETTGRLAGLPTAERAETGQGVAGELDLEPWLDRSRDTYLQDIKECKEQLHAGESYEICLTNTVELPTSALPYPVDASPGVDPLALYRRQRRANPAPHAAYLRLGGTQVLCSSPERFLKVGRDRVVESRPIKGTAPRDPDPVADAAAAAELAAGPKTRAENLMIVDLLRNDLGRVCEVGTVEVPALMRVESYATVHQLVSTVRGRLRDDLSAVDAVRACFPGGSMTGAPKLRTMEILDRLETRARGIYSGAIGFLGLDGTADLNIVIRTIVARDGRRTVGAGGAIVLDSDPESEYEEMLLKARAPLRALST